MSNRATTSRLAVAFAVLLLCGHAAMSKPLSISSGVQEQPVVGVYFDDPYKLLEPFDRDFRRSCSCVENAFALIPRIVGESRNFIVPLRPGKEYFRYLRDGADSRWTDPNDALAPAPRMLITGRGIPPIVGELAITAAIEGYKELAERGQSDAQAELGYLFAVGLGVPQSDQWAAFWYEQAASQNLSQASLAVAAMYAIGRGVPRDEQIAFYWLLQSQNLQVIGDAYACGLGVDQDLERARDLYEAESVRHYTTDVQYQLGTMFLNGCGAPVDYELASQWLRRAAGSGHPEAQITISEMMNQGLVPGVVDPTSAYMYAEFALTRLTEPSPTRARAFAARDQAFAKIPASEQADSRDFLERVLAASAEALVEDQKSLNAAAKLARQR